MRVLKHTDKRDVLRVRADCTASGSIRLRRLRVHRVERTRIDQFDQSVDRLFTPRPAVEFPIGELHS